MQEAPFIIKKWVNILNQNLLVNVVCVLFAVLTRKQDDQLRVTELFVALVIRKTQVVMVYLRLL